MRTSKALITAVCVSNLICPAIMAQDSALAVVQERKFNHWVNIESVYDESRDQTVVVMRWDGVVWPAEEKPRSLFEPPPWFEPSRMLAIQVAFSYPGRKLRSVPETAQFEIDVSQPGPSRFKASDMPELLATVDGQEISLGKTSLSFSKSRVNPKWSKQESHDRLVAYITYPGLLRIVNAEEVTMSVGEVEFELSQRNLEALRDLASRTVL